MKLKNLSFFERHVEKIAIAATALILAVVAYFYVLGTPNEVRINNRQVRPAEVGQVILSEAERLDRVLQDDPVAEPLENLTVPPYTQEFRDRLLELPLPQPAFRVAAAQPAVFPGISEGTPESRKPYHVPTVPMPNVLASRASIGTIEPSDVEQYPVLATSLNLPENGPYDAAWVSILGRFDLKAMHDQLRAEGGEQERPLPVSWWASTFAVADVQMQRLERRPDGTWPREGDADYSNYTTIVPPMPTQQRFRETIEGIQPDLAAELVRLIQQDQLNVVQPFFPLLVNDVWAPPDPDAAETDEEGQLDEILELKKKIEQKQRLLETLKRRLDEIQNPRRPQQRANRGAAPGGQQLSSDVQAMITQAQEQARNYGGGAPMGPSAADVQRMREQGMREGGITGGPGGGRTPTQQAPRVDPRKRQIEQWEQRIERQEEELQKLLEQYRDLTGSDATPQPPSRRRTLAPLAQRRPTRTPSSPTAGGAMGMGGPSPEELARIRQEAEARGGGAMSMGGPSPEELARIREQAEAYGRGGAPAPTPSAPGAPRAAAAPTTVQRDLSRFEATRAALERLRGPGEAPAAAEEQAEEQTQAVSRLGRFPLDPPTLDLWATDMYAEPGKTYRYRLRVGIVNPLFGKDDLPQPQQEHRDRLVLYSDWSDWTEPIDVEPMEYFFLLAEAQNPPPGNVTVEVWRYYGATWQKAEFRLEPGDPIGEARELAAADAPQPQPVKVDFFTGKFVVDIDFDFPVAGDTATEQTTRLLYMEDGQVRSRRLDRDRENKKRQWLELQQEQLGAPVIGMNF